MKIEFIWERLDDETQRAKVFGGWVVYTSDIDDETRNSVGAAMVFVPDCNHEWNLKCN